MVEGDFSFRGLANFILVKKPDESLEEIEHWGVQQRKNQQKVSPISQLEFGSLRELQGFLC